MTHRIGTKITHARLWILVATIFIFLGLPAVGHTQNTAQGCAVSANYAEAIDENHRTLVKLLGMVNLAPSPLENSETAALYHTMLVSTRQYHEEARQNLLNCAQELNIVTIQTISATQDVITMMLVQQANPEHRRYNYRLEQAREHLNQTWQTLLQVADKTQLTAQE